VYRFSGFTVIESRRTSLPTRSPKLSCNCLNTGIVTLLDEPFASLDSPFRLHLRRELLRILRQLNLSVVLVTHDPQEAYELVEEVIVIAAGRVLQQGRREEVFGFPSSALVAKLLGFRNTFRGQVIASTPEANFIATFLRCHKTRPTNGAAPGSARMQKERAENASRHLRSHETSATIWKANLPF
jgi:ABC-type sulfate/molybdate transport systems ATPase subunit